MSSSLSSAFSRFGRAFFFSHAPRDTMATTTYQYKVPGTKTAHTILLRREEVARCTSECACALDDFTVSCASCIDNKLIRRCVGRFDPTNPCQTPLFDAKLPGSFPFACCAAHVMPYWECLCIDVPVFGSINDMLPGKIADLYVRQLEATAEFVIRQALGKILLWEQYDIKMLISEWEDSHAAMPLTPEVTSLPLFQEMRRNGNFTLQEFFVEAFSKAEIDQHAWCNNIFRNFALPIKIGQMMTDMCTFADVLSVTDFKLLGSDRDSKGGPFVLPYKSLILSSLPADFRFNENKRLVLQMITTHEFDQRMERIKNKDTRPLPKNAPPPLPAAKPVELRPPTPPPPMEVVEFSPARSNVYHPREPVGEEQDESEVAPPTLFEVVAPNKRERDHQPVIEAPVPEAKHEIWLSDIGYFDWANLTATDMTAKFFTTGGEDEDERYWVLYPIHGKTEGLQAVVKTLAAARGLRYTKPIDDAEIYILPRNPDEAEKVTELKRRVSPYWNRGLYHSFCVDEYGDEESMMSAYHMHLQLCGAQGTGAFKGQAFTKVMKEWLCKKLVSSELSPEMDVTNSNVCQSAGIVSENEWFDNVVDEERKTMEGERAYLERQKEHKASSKKHKVVDLTI